MNNFKEDKEFAKRQDNAKEVLVVFPKISEGDFQNFVIVDGEGNQKYDGFVEGSRPTEIDDCKCPSFTNNNNSKAEGSYIATHGHAFQCKHILAARESAALKKMEISAN